MTGSKRREVTPAQLRGVVSRCRGYYTSETPDIYHSDPNCVWGNKIYQRFLREGRGKNRRRCRRCKS